MALVWRVRTVTMETAETLGTLAWEPFAVVEDDDGTPLVVLKGLVEDEGERSSTRPENKVVWTPDV
jgi:hypothetical protein